MKKIMGKVTRQILPGFTAGDKILWHTWKGFGWFGKLQVELDGEFCADDQEIRREESGMPSYAPISD